METKINIFWFRRDLRLDDNTALNVALSAGLPVQCIFIFDENILSELPRDDARVTFIHKRLDKIQQQLVEFGSALLVKKGKPIEVYSQLTQEFSIAGVYANEDYEPYAKERDAAVGRLLNSQGIKFYTFKDQVIFSPSEISKSDGKPYTVYTPFSKKWKEQFFSTTIHVENKLNHEAFLKCSHEFPSLEKIGFKPTSISLPPLKLNEQQIREYAAKRNFPAENATTRLGIHLRFGTVSIRKLALWTSSLSDTFLSELIWREFFMHILYHFPRVVTTSFREEYDNILWINDEKDFERWKTGTTGYPLVDAGMRELNATGFMHNRVRMVVASFLCKHLLIDWRWGEQYFALKLLDFDLSANNGNWQWAAGCGCDAAPYFRVFNPQLQAEKFDPTGAYQKKWVPELGTKDYPIPLVEHSFARQRAINTYKSALQP